MKPISIITLGLGSLLASAVSAQTPTPDGTAVQKSTRLPAIRVQPRRAAATHNRAVKRAGSGRTPGYVENDINAVKFGSKNWWTVQGWQSGPKVGK